MQPLFSVRMRAAVGAAHEAGGRHLSGAERLVPEPEVETTILELVRRARSRGISPDFIRLTVDRVDPQSVERIGCLPVTTVESQGPEAALAVSHHLLREAGIEEPALREAFAALREGWGTAGPLRGAAVLDARSGRRLDPDRCRGVRVSRLDYAGPTVHALEAALSREGLGHFRVREALAIASKVLWAGVAAELCWSDDPGYSTGYVATPRHGYVRLPRFRPGGAVGGRVFFWAGPAEPEALERLVERLERTPVWIDGPVDIRPAVQGWE